MVAGLGGALSTDSSSRFPGLKGCGDEEIFLLLSGAIVWLNVLPSRAPAVESVALKSGESVDLSNLFWVANCHSLLKGPMKLDVLEAPPEITASIREQSVVPHSYNCPAAVKGGVLVPTAAAGVQKKVQAKVSCG